MEDRQILLDRLAQAERNIADGTEQIRRQRELVISQKLTGSNRKRALDTLFGLEEVLGIYIAARDRLQKELGM
jgi:hypothetical protein